MQQIRIRGRIPRILFAALIVTLITFALAPTAIATRITTEVVAIDRTGSTTNVTSWSTEVAGIVRGEATKAIHAGIDRLTIISIGANTADTAKVAEVNLGLDCTNSNTCADDAAALAKQIGSIAGQVASVPVTTPGSDLIAGLQTAAAVCGRARCKVTLITDGQDTRLYSSTTPGDQLAQQVAPIVPSLKNTVVHLIGQGADGSPPNAVERVRTFWQVLLGIKHAHDIRIARSL
jgi:hypothetical protein